MAKKKTGNEMMVAEDMRTETVCNEVTNTSPQSEPDTETEPEMSET